MYGESDETIRSSLLHDLKTIIICPPSLQINAFAISHPCIRCFTSNRKSAKAFNGRCSVCFFCLNVRKKELIAPLNSVLHIQHVSEKQHKCLIVDRVSVYITIIILCSAQPPLPAGTTSRSVVLFPPLPHPTPSHPDSPFASRPPNRFSRPSPIFLRVPARSISWNRP